MLETLLKHLKEQKDLGLTNDILMETFKSAIKPLKYSDKEVYDEVVDKLYKECYGEHFSDWLAEKAVENFKNVDGTEGAHWSVEQIDDVIRQYGIKCIGFNRWDLYFVMNMLYSDYYNVLGSDTATYVKRLGLKIPMLAKAKLIATICKSPKLNLKSTFFGMYSFLLTF